GLERIADLARQVRVALDEAREVPLGQPEQVVVHEHLAVALAAGADADRRHRHASRDLRGYGAGAGSEHARDRAGSLERKRTYDEARLRLCRLALCLEAAEHRR